MAGLSDGTFAGPIHALYPNYSVGKRACLTVCRKGGRSCTVIKMHDFTAILCEGERAEEVGMSLRQLPFLTPMIGVGANIS